MMSAKSVIAVSGISGNVTVAFVALSYAGGLNVTVVADPQRCPDLHDVAAAGGSSPEPVVIVRMVALGAGRSLADRRGLPGRHRHGALVPIARAGAHHHHHGNRAQSQHLAAGGAEHDPGRGAAATGPEHHEPSLCRRGQERPRRVAADDLNVHRHVGVSL